MFQIICKIGPLSIIEYSIFIAIIAAVGTVALMILAFLGGIKRRAIFIVLFWVMAFAILAIIPLITTITIYSYGLMLAIAVVICTLMLVQDARRKNINVDIIFDLVFWAVAGGIIGARLFYVCLNFPYFIENPFELIMIQKGGLAWQGGLILGALTSITYVKMKKLSISQMVDIAAPYLALGQSIGRIGCFLNGCCFGKETAGGIYFPVHDAVLHPTQLYLAGGLFIIFLILKRYQKFSEIPGLVFALYLILASCLRFGVEFFRADHDIIFIGLSIYQFVCFGVLIFALCFAGTMLIKHSRSEDS